ncbi:Large exoprotein involved in heme utilization or adhesion (FhaB) (PDB:4RM6) [Commensalibacter communis]|uniref:Large exoprotein involved in heme utilization or adhesion (FhaB) n=1 Tax=Commensalibacter communis TaxID=2972786 RepID=A0A9W4TNI3_9PROT|nr:Hint domain-containing protein [Commensalibacter communis]CAI3943513.1 Large exoprotein involved in heme utilization or adhesion (FhaB) (PDB:4RM6) [Commensalibacter communis]CAI3951016.1 Large exoprotein involved in heme utilization or adhesion (FhaB) (PDB:4RM6) [Commensalibacter communis]CAI3952636.1 Large exoprotein involved in heme utilization or adhesion (FhaB) (PDB:4RM6) [Commensalibacter communis]CAI3959923.1 Large exoprotein involved in heme utilization or adhesion (FhaB) (PDB:4RM6) [
MSNNINQDTNFSNVTITNEYPCLIGGTWTAQLKDDKTVYVSSDGSQTIEGPVNLIGANLTIASGAIVSYAVIVGNSSNSSPKITVQAGGTIENSDIFNGAITIADGGTSSSNNYVGEAITFNSGSASLNDTFYNPGNAGTSSGTLNLSQLPAGTSTSFTTSSKNGSIKTAANVKVLNFSAPNLTANNANASKTGTLSFRVNHSSEYGSANISQEPHADYSNNQFTLTNDYPSYVGGTWTASLVDGKTVYSNGTLNNIEGPINLINIRGMTINSGAVVDGITMTGTTTPTIYNNGTIQNSFVANGYLQNGSNTTTGISRNNTYISQITYIYNGSVTENDYFYEPGSSYGKYNLTNTPSGTPATFHLGDGKGNIYLYQGASFQDSYVGTGSGAIIDVYQYNGAAVSNYSNSDVCFLGGTLIDTPNGAVAVENLQIGDKVVSYSMDGVKNSLITWVGHKKVNVRKQLSEDQAGYPVRILKDAISDGVPFKDLLITAEHCLFLNDQFIPARMLVNNSSIFYDVSFTEYTYYHIETEDHSVITADGMQTESYLDTGNRSSFQDNSNVIPLYPKAKQWNIDSAYPLVVTREIVEPIYQQLVGRAASLGLQSKSIELPVTQDAGLHLVTNNGEVIHKAHESKGRFSFVIPRNTSSVRLVSRTSKPSHIIGPFVDDRRHLGVLVGNITLLTNSIIYPIEDHIEYPRLQGWDVKEQGPHRWTNGNAVLNLANHGGEESSVIVIHVLAGGPYIAQDHEMSEKIAINQ